MSRYGGHPNNHTHPPSVNRRHRRQPPPPKPEPVIQNKGKKSGVCSKFQNGLAEFFGFGNESKKQRWRIRRMHFYKRDQIHDDKVKFSTLQGMNKNTVLGTRKNLRYRPGTKVDRPDHMNAGLAYSYHYSDDRGLLDELFYDELATASDVRGARTDGRSSWYRPPTRGHQAESDDDEDSPVKMFGLRRMEAIVVDDLEAKDDAMDEGSCRFFQNLLGVKGNSTNLSSYMDSQRDDQDDHIPFFTYWVTLVQVLVFIVSIAVYGIAPIGTDVTKNESLIMMPNLAIKQVTYTVSDNLWIGPTQEDLIHIGAKYSPCMRYDDNIYAGINKDREEEKTSGCCVRNDGSGCVQTVSRFCSTKTNTFIKWNSTNPGQGGYESGAVCGQDPNYCQNPASSGAFKWDTKDITNWPLCQKTSKSTVNTSIQSTDRHMSCELTGRPCCHGIRGECMITTKEHCEFLRGYYDTEEFLCSQSKCLKKICGMIPFSDPDKPDQYYRLWTAMFLHGGVFHLLITLGFQLIFMRRLERFSGTIRMTIIYVGSGVAGNLASSVFLPYHVEVGPAGAQFGILAGLLVDLLKSLSLLQRPGIQILKIGGIILFFFLLGFLPWIDNWAHICGFLFGFLLSLAILPGDTFGELDDLVENILEKPDDSFENEDAKLRTTIRSVLGIVFSLGLAILLFIVLTILFYVLPLYDCPGCQYINCIPFTSTFCKNMEVNIERESTYSSYF